MSKLVTRAGVALGNDDLGHWIRVGDALAHVRRPVCACVECGTREGDFSSDGKLDWLPKGGGFSSDGISDKLLVEGGSSFIE